MLLRFLKICLALFYLSACRPGTEDDFSGLKFHEPAEGPSPIAAFNAQESKSSEWGPGILPGYTLVKFDIRKYANLDSLIFRADVFSTDRSARCFVRLYNFTDNEPIPFSEISRRVGVSRSENLMGAFPQKEIELGIQIRSEREGARVGVRDYSLLFAYQNYR